VTSCRNKVWICTPGKERVAEEGKPKEMPDVSDSGFFVLRSPALPVDELLTLSAGLKAAELYPAKADSQCMERAWRADVQMLRDRLRNISQRPEIVYALFVASPSLQSGIEHWRRDPESKKGLQAERTLVRYFTRMCSRPTPFGLFSGCSVGKIVRESDADSPALSLQRSDQYRICSRLDFDYLVTLTDCLRRDPAVAMNLRYSPNTSLHRLADGWHYVASRIVASGRTHRQMELEGDRYFDAVFERAQTVATVPELVETTLSVTDCELDSESARVYVQELIANGVLVSSLSPAVTGGSPIDDIIAQVEALPFPAGVADTLRWTRDSLAGLDRKGMRASPEEYRAIASRLETLPAELDLARLFQVDMIKPVQEAVLTKPVVDELIWGAEVLRRLGQPAEPYALRSFREAFSARYDRASVPLLEALDEEVGLGFGAGTESSSLLRGLQFDAASSGAGLSPNPVLLQKVTDCARCGNMELQLDVSDLPRSSNSMPGLPDSFAVMATLIARSVEAVRDGHFQVKLGGVWGPGGARYMARFCHTDAELDRYVRHHIREEEACDPDAVFAEVVHLHDERMGNVLCRPVLREYELVYLGRSGTAPDRQLPVGDLLVAVERGRIALYSHRLRRRIIPRVTNAHGYTNPQLEPVYRFLCSLQRQGTYSGGFSWGALDSLAFLPRVRIGRLVLAVAQWRLTSSEIASLTEHAGSRLFADVQEFRRCRSLPRWVVLQETDQALPIDLDNALSVEAFVHVLKRQSTALLQEMYPSPEEACVTSPEGVFHHELIVPFVSDVHAEETQRVGVRQSRELLLTKTQRSVTRQARSLPPGGDWLYVKLYAGVDTLDDLLKTALPPLLRAAFASGAVSRWFFLRFSDPQQHLRIRFHGNADGLRQKLMPLVSGAFNPLLASGRVWKIQFDTYEREIERYGGVEGALAAEDIFFADSEAVLKVLHTLCGEKELERRWQIALLGADMLLSDCHFSLEAKRTVMDQLRAKYHREFRLGAGVRQQLADRFRADRRLLTTLLDDLPERDGHLMYARHEFELRSTRVMKIVDKLELLAQSGELHADMSELACTFVHLHINRLLRSSPREHECVLYYFLFRLYDGKLARQKRMRESVSVSDRSCGY
jgi:thiopeptide-type bacteriocin biosynthesis protein